MRSPAGSAWTWNPKALAETGLALIAEAVLWFMFDPTNARTKRDDLHVLLGIPFELGHEVLKHLSARR